MKTLIEHIDEFERLMSAKGFDGYFLCNFGCRGTLKESLQQHFSEEPKDQVFTRPFHLTTYSFWKEDKHIKCDFKMIYDRLNGLKVDKLEAGYLVNHELNPVRTIELRPKRNEDIPTRVKVNSMIGPRNKRRFKL